MEHFWLYFFKIPIYTIERLYNLKVTLFIIIFGMLVYLGTSTLFGESELMGIYGSIFALYNQYYFGYISYIYILALLVPLYLFYKNTNFNFRKAEIIIHPGRSLYLYRLLIGRNKTEFFNFAQQRFQY